MLSSLDVAEQRRAFFICESPSACWWANLLAPALPALVRQALILFSLLSRSKRIVRSEAPRRTSFYPTRPIKRHPDLILFLLFFPPDKVQRWVLFYSILLDISNTHLWTFHSIPRREQVSVILLGLVHLSSMIAVQMVVFHVCVCLSWC